MSNIFNGCSSLTSLPDISKWDTKKVNTKDKIFERCSSLISLPDISKWNFLDNPEIEINAFDGCNSLVSLPNIAQFDSYEYDHLKKEYISLINKPNDF